jgi:hypothetical protein
MAATRGSVAVRPSCTREPAMPQCSSTSAHSGSTGNGQGRHLRSSTTSSPARIPTGRSPQGSRARTGRRRRRRCPRRSATPTDSVPTRAPRERCRRGTPPTPARAVLTRLHAGAQGASTASPDDRRLFAPHQNVLPVGSDPVEKQRAAVAFHIAGRSQRCNARTPACTTPYERD